MPANYWKALLLVSCMAGFITILLCGLTRLRNSLQRHMRDKYHDIS